jgi:GTP-binding protein Era
MEPKLKSGMVTIIGRPNVGKSTLLNKIIKEKVSIVSKVPQTTRSQIRGIYTDDRGQIVFLDTPGLHRGGDRLDKYMNKVSTGSISDVDCIIYLVDTNKRIGPEEESVAHQLRKTRSPVIFGLNKVDLKAAYFDEYIRFWESVKGQDVQSMKNVTLMPLSSKNGINIEVLLDTVFGYLPEGELLYPEDIISDTPRRLAVADIIREKLFRNMRKEVPHQIGVTVESMKPVKGKTLRIRAVIFVARQTQKEIVIGRQGAMLKKVGTEARKDLEDLLEGKVFLDLLVKVQKRWRDDALLLQELGYE